LAMLTVTGVLLPLARSMEMGGDTLRAAMSMLPAVLQQTHFGHVWILHLVALLLLWIGWRGAKGNAGRSSAIGMLVTAVLMTWTYSATSHAADQGDFSMVQLGDWGHVIAASLWGGGILATGMLLPALWTIASKQRLLIGQLVSRLSKLSTVALVLVLVSGVYNATTRINSAEELLHTSYGHVLTVKLLLVAAMAVIGALNRFILVPATVRWATALKGMDDRPLRRFVAAIQVDMVCVLLVLCVVALLIQSMPPSSMSGMAEALMQRLYG
ncbi:MAG TPA: CopD family protein, partial [Burkholderiaceae bacterium]|nr:CopD family protein [Burkholderiaceae bacterium]